MIYVYFIQVLAITWGNYLMHDVTTEIEGGGNKKDITPPPFTNTYGSGLIIHLANGIRKAIFLRSRSWFRVYTGTQYNMVGPGEN